MHDKRLSKYDAVKNRIINRAMIMAFHNARQLGFSLFEAEREAHMVASFIMEMSGEQAASQIAGSPQ